MPGPVTGVQDGGSLAGKLSSVESAALSWLLRRVRVRGRLGRAGAVSGTTSSTWSRDHAMLPSAKKQPRISGNLSAGKTIAAPTMTAPKRGKIGEFDSGVSAGKPAAGTGVAVSAISRRLL